MSNYKAMTSRTLDTEVGYQHPYQDLPDKVSMDDPATHAMTDLSKVAALTINPCASLDNASERMIASNVRLLFVTNQYYHVMGIITSNDLAGSKAMNYLKEMGGKREEIMVRDLMTPQHQIEVLDMAEVSRAKIGDLVTTLKRMGRQHALVVEYDSDNKQVIRGVLSANQLGKQLGTDISTADVAGSFADLTKQGG